MASPAVMMMNMNMNSVSRKRKTYSRMNLDESNDRFMPSINQTRLSLSPSKEESGDNRLYMEHLKEALGIKKQRLLSFKVDHKDLFANTSDNALNLPLFQVKERGMTAKEVAAKGMRHVSSAPVRTLDAPGITNDFYLNLIHWSQENVLAVALANTCYLWNADKGEIAELCEFESSSISSVKFNDAQAEMIAVGLDESNPVTLIYNTENAKCVRTLQGHESRVSALDWNGMILATASKDSKVLLHDVRIKHSIVQVLEHHTSEVCSLAWDRSGSLLATGSNDNNVGIYDFKGTKLQHNLVGHTSSVKALAWNPHRPNILATGGGSLDRTIKLWNASSGKLTSEHKVGNQVSSIWFNPFEDELAATVGDNINIYTYPRIERFIELKGHTERILGSALSPCGTTVCSAGADETLRFWNVFEASKQSSIAQTKQITPQFVTQKLR